MNFNGAFFHLALNHLPVLLPIVGAGVLAVGTFWNLKQTQNVGLWLLVIGALSALPTYFTGEPAEDIVQNYPLITRSSIETHEDSALYSLIAIEIVGAMGLLVLFMKKKGQDISRNTFLMLIGLTLIASLLIARTAHLGGLIRHEELLHGEFHGKPSG